MIYLTNQLILCDSFVMSDDIQVNQVLVAILEMLRDLHLYSERQHHWIVALRYAIQSDPDLESRLKDHPWFDLRSRPICS